MSLYIIILLVAVAISACIIYFGIKNAEEVDRNDRPITKFEPRKVVDLSTPTSIPPIKEDVIPVSTEKAIAPKKKKHYKKRTKKSE